MNNKKYAVGQKMYSIIRDNIIRDTIQDNMIVEYTVTKVGRKYLTVAQIDEERQKSYDERKFYIEDLYEKTEFGTPKLLFASYKEVQEYLDRKRISFKLYNWFGSYYRTLSEYSIETLKKIEELVMEEKSKNAN